MSRHIVASIFAFVLTPGFAFGADNLVVNGGFDDDVAGWDLSAFATATWSELDDLGNAGSGSLRLSAVNADKVPSYFSNCFAVTPGRSMVFGASARGPLGGAPDNLGVRASLRWFAVPDCGGTTMGQALGDVDYSLDASTWGPTQGSAVIPPGAQSAVLILRLFPGASPPEEVYLDNAFVYEDALCAATAKVGCLNDRRFRVSIRWAIPDGTQGYASMAAFTGDSARATFFSPANVEIVLKVLDGCPVNERYWVFAAGLTNVEVEITVTDTHTGQTWTRSNPLNTAYAPIQDTAAFAACPH